MNDVIVEGFFMLGAAALGGMIAIIGSRSGAQVTKLKEEKEKLRIQLDKLLRQVEAYHLLEDLYAHELSEKDGKKAVKTIKTEYRNKIVEVHQCVRPKMTANEAKKYLQDLTH